MNVMCNLSDVILERGIEQGSTKMFDLFSFLSKENKQEELNKALESKEYAFQLIEKYHI